MSSESRVVRPFLVDNDLVTILRNSALTAGTLRCCPGERVIAESHNFAMPDWILDWAPEETFGDFKKALRFGARQTGVALTDMCLVVTVRSGYLKYCEQVFVFPLSNLPSLDRRVPVSGRSDDTRRPPFCAGSHGAVIDAYVALHRPLARPKKLLPSRKGAWLAHAEFRVQNESDSELFRPQPLDDENRRQLRLGKNTTRFLELDSSTLTMPLADVDLPTFWVDEELLSEIARQRGAATSQYFQRQLALDCLAGVIAAFSQHVDHDVAYSYDDIQDSLIGRVVTLLIGTGTLDRSHDRILKDCRDDPARMIAHAEDALGLCAAALKPLSQ